MTRSPDVSLVIPSRAGAARLPVLLRALEGQNNTSWEAIVVLDGDIDDSEQVVAAFRHLPVRTIVFPENRGRVSALNAGFDAAQGRVLARCDDDLEPGPHYVARLIERHRREPTGVIGLPLNVFPDNDYVRVYGGPTDRQFRQDAYRRGPDTLWRLWGGNVSVTRESYDLVGPYDPNYRAYGWEDVDWGFRLHEAGIRIVLAPELATPHHAAAQSVELRAQRAFHSGAARVTFEAKHGTKQLPPAIPTDHSPWNILVRAVGQLRRDPLMTLAQRLDTLLGWMPGPVARKLIAMTVEGAGASGYAHADQARADF